MSHFQSKKQSNTINEVDFYRHKDHSQTNSESMLSSNQSDASRNQTIRVCVRVRPILRHERNLGDVLFYPQTRSNDGLEVSERSLFI